MKTQDAVVGTVAVYHSKRVGSPNRKAPTIVVEIIETGVDHRYEVKTGGWDFSSEYRNTNQGLRVKVVDAPEATQYLGIGEEFTVIAAQLDNRGEEISDALTRITRANERRAASQHHDDLAEQAAAAWGWEYDKNTRFALTALTDDQLRELIQNKS